MLPLGGIGDSKAITGVMIDIPMHITYSQGTIIQWSPRRRAREPRMACKNALITTAGMIVALLFGFARAQDAALAPMLNASQDATTTRTQTLKERLGDKASDEQRVDNCKVPVERRGTKVRPDGCEPAVTVPAVG